MTNDKKTAKFGDVLRALNDPNPGDLMVWYVPQVPMPAFHWPVKSLKEGANLVEALRWFSAYEHGNRIKPDYADVGGVSRYEENGDGGFDWYDVDEDELPEAPEPIGAGD